MPTIRLANEGDIPSINAVTNWAIVNTTAHFSLEPEPDGPMLESWRQTREMFPWLVGLDEKGTFLGYAKASAWNGRCAYDWAAEVTVYVHPEHHRKGVGRALYGRLFEILKAQGYRTLIGGITLGNPASVALHESMGMRKVAEFPSVGFKFGKWMSVGYWAVELGEDNGEPAQIQSVASAVSALDGRDSLA